MTSPPPTDADEISPPSRRRRGVWWWMTHPVVLGVLLLADTGWVVISRDGIPRHAHDLIVNLYTDGRAVVGGPTDWIEPDASVVIRVAALNTGGWAQPIRRTSVTSASMDLPRRITPERASAMAGAALLEVAGPDGPVYAAMLEDGVSSHDRVRPWALVHNLGAGSVAMLFVLGLVIRTRALHERARRSRLGCCTECGYDLARLVPGTRCPECGSAGVPINAPS